MARRRATEVLHSLPASSVLSPLPGFEPVRLWRRRGGLWHGGAYPLAQAPPEGETPMVRRRATEVRHSLPMARGQST